MLSRRSGGVLDGEVDRFFVNALLLELKFNQQELPVVASELLKMKPEP